MRGVAGALWPAPPPSPLSPWFLSRRRGTHHRNHRAGPPGPLTGETSFLLEWQSPPRGGGNPVSPRGRAFPSRDLRSPQGGLERGAVAAAALSAGLAGLWLSGRSLSESNPSRAGKPDDLTLKTSLLLLLLFLKAGTFSNRSRK